MAPSIEPARGYTALETALDGQAAVQARRQQRERVLMGLAGAYMVVGGIIFYFVEGWDFLQTVVFNLSIFTGVGYGHVAPVTDAGKLITAGWIFCGLIVFASVGGQVLRLLMSWEIDVVTKAFENSAESESFHDKRVAERRTQFLAGAANACVMYALAVLFFMIRFHDGFADAVYTAAVSVFNLDSACTHAGVKCGVGTHESTWGQVGDLVLTIIWYIVMFATMSHFVVSFASYIGTDSSPVLSRIKMMDKSRLERMDADRDGKVSKTEFLRDRLIQGGICQDTEIDQILKNFDELDKEKTGVLMAS